MTMAADSNTPVENKDEILTSAVSANTHIPSVSASAVLGESESVRCSLLADMFQVVMYQWWIFNVV